jgi:putative ABC transport system substrate-binding protein
MCGLTLTRREWLSMALAASAGTILPRKAARAAGVSQAARALLEKAITVDAHSHAVGLIFGARMNDSLATGMRQGMISAICLAHVPDGPVIERNAAGLMAYAADLEDESYRAAAYVDKIVKGAKPGDLPVEQPTKFDLVINLKSAKASGIALPESLLLQASRVIQ